MCIDLLLTKVGDQIPDKIDAWYVLRVCVARPLRQLTTREHRDESTHHLGSV